MGKRRATHERAGKRQMETKSRDQDSSSNDMTSGQGGGQNKPPGNREEREGQDMVGHRPPDNRNGRGRHRKAVTSPADDGVQVVRTSSELLESYVKRDNKKKVFRPQVSILTHLCSTDKNCEALYHSFIVMVCTAIVYSLMKDSVEAGKSVPFVDMDYYFTGFGPLWLQLVAAIIWIPLQLAVLLVYPSFLLWHKLRPFGGLAVDIFFILLFIAYNVAAHTTTVYSIVSFDLPPVPALFLSVEQLRWTMKTYSFLRENAYKVLHPWNKDDEDGPAVWYDGQMEPHIGSFSAYLYFLFCPTLLYRDNYPRTERVRLLRVIAYLFKCVILLTFVVVLCKEIFDSYPSLDTVHLASLPPQVFIFTFLACSLWGLVLQFITGYFFLHSWLNLWSEILCFADREFYSDWWTCTSFSAFYRKWNFVVHDWIKAYIYQDLKDLFNSPWYNRIAFLPTIVISGMFHEYVLWAPSRFFLPLLLIMFGIFGSLLYFVRPRSSNNLSRLSNYFLHFSLNIGVSMMLFVYSTEFYARKHCVKEETLLNTFIPRFYECFWLSPSYA